MSITRRFAGTRLSIVAIVAVLGAQAVDARLTQREPPSGTGVPGRAGADARTEADRALEFRRLQQQDEHGDVPADGLIGAKRHADQMRRLDASSPAVSAAGTSPVKWTWLGPGNLGVAEFYGAAGNSVSGTIVGGTQDHGTLRYTTAGGPQAYAGLLGGIGGQVASDPGDPDYFYGEYPGLGIFRSSNGGESPEVFFGDSIPDFNGNSLFIAPFVLDQNNPDTLLAGGMSLWRTTNAKFGYPPSFTSIKGPTGSYVSAITIAPGSSEICWAGYQNGDVYKTTDCTAASPTWTQVDKHAGLPNRMVLRLTIDPSDPSGNRVYAAFGGFSAANLWRTTNGGASWRAVSGAGIASLPAAPVHDLEIHPNTSSWLYAATEIGVFTSHDAGRTWQPPQDGPADVVVSELFWMGPDLVAATFGRGLYKTTAGNLVNTNAVSSPRAIDLASTEAAAATKLFWDDMESGVDGWSAQAPWAITAESAHSPDHAWSDSPGGAYGPNLNVSILTPVIDLTGATSPELTFWHKREFAADGFDSGQVWATTDLGSTYTLLATYTGTDPEWSQATIDLSAYAGLPSLRVAFQVQSDADLTGDGWYVDDVAVANVPPPPFGKSQPADGSTDLPIPQGLGLTWHESAGATSYEYCYDTVNNDTCDTSWHDAGTSTAAGVDDLARGATYFWQVRARRGLAVVEADGGTWWSFSTSGDVTPPTVTAKTPANGATGVSTATVVTATFSEAIDDFTVFFGGFRLRDPANAVVNANVTYNRDTFVATLTPTSPLAPSTTYTATVSEVVKDMAGNALASPVVWSFTTSGPATLGLTTVGSSIDSGDRNFLNGSKVTTTAAGQVQSMSVYVGAVDSQPANRQYQLGIYSDRAGRPGRLVAVSGTGTLVGNAWNTLPIAAPLSGNTSYWLMFNTNGRTASVNNMRYNVGAAGRGAYSAGPVQFGTWPATFPAATSTNFVFSLFATLRPDATGNDTAPPVVNSVTPVNGAAGVSTATTMTATFSEPINAATLSTSTFALRRGNALVPATVSYNATTRVGTLTPSSVLAAGTAYTATLTGGGEGVTDVAGNPLAGDVVWSFTTSGAAPATLGLTAIGGSVDSADSNFLNGSKATTTAAGQIASMSVYVGAVDSMVARREYQLAIYTDNGGRPGTLVATSATGTLVANAWNTLQVSASLAGNTTYWLMFNTNGRSASVNNMHYNNGPTGRGAYSTGPVPFGTWPAAFPGATLTNFRFSLFATFGP